MTTTPTPVLPKRVQIRAESQNGRPVLVVTCSACDTEVPADQLPADQLTADDVANLAAFHAGC